MKIKNIEVFTFQAGWREWSFIKIDTNTIISGWAECSDTFKNINGFCGILKDFKDIILDEESLDIKRIVWKLKTKSKSSPGSLIQRVISAIENALWDIAGKHAKAPVHKLFGKKTPVHNYFLSPFSLNIFKNKFRNVSKCLSFIEFTDFLKHYPVYTPYGLNEKLRHQANPGAFKKTFYYITSKSLGVNSYYFMPSLASIFVRNT